jgi:hypothetical protein
MDDLTLRALALLELTGQQFSAETFDNFVAVLGVDSPRIAVRLAGLFRCYLEAQGTPVQAWIDEYRARVLAADEAKGPGLA